ncbi:MAG: 3'-5' exonuclease [Opitutaceae bacterium]|jgi:DNA polymerase III epsilon subunit-like protein|nr:3'-5' exonuclease [Opitutaceae bacterium]
MSGALSSVVVVDVETTGIDPERCGILEIGAVALVSGAEFSVYCSVPFGVRVEARALEVNGVRYEDIHDRSHPLDWRCVVEFDAWCRERGLSLLAGMNPSFDLGFLKAAGRRVIRDELGEPFVSMPAFPHRTLDMHSVAVAWAVRHGVPVPARGFYTDAIYGVLGFPPEAKPHRAIEGARREAEALRVLLGLVDGAAVDSARNGGVV